MRSQEVTATNFSPGTWRGPRSRHTLLLEMARDAEKLAAQGDRIRELRKFARVSQEVAAGAVGVTLRGYQRWERGEGEINVDNLRKLAAYYGTSEDYIEYGEVERGKTPDPFASNGVDIEAQLAELKELLVGIQITQQILLAAIQGPESKQRPAPTARRQRAS